MGLILRPLRLDFMIYHMDRFAQADIHEIAPDLLNALLTKIESAGTAEKVAENEHLMKCTISAPLLLCTTLFKVLIQVPCE